MTFIYRQTNGHMTKDDHLIGVGYSGNGEGLNNPDKEREVAVGPIPRGQWHIDRWDEHHGEKGPIVAVLSPVGHDAHGRSEFLIHGPHANDHQDSSHGCIILARPIREAMRASGDMDLLVTA